MLIDEKGQAYGMGRNDAAQLGASDLEARSIPVPFNLPDGPHIVKAASCGRAHTIVMTETGKCFSVGLNATGQLGAGVLSSTETYESTWQPVAVPSDEVVVSVAAGSDFSVFACASGAVFAAGNGEHGKLGNGRTGEHIVSSTKVSFDAFHKPQRVAFPPDVSITQVAAGTVHVIALDIEGKVWSWGFGGYGRLGHRSPQNELRPRKIETFFPPHYKLDYVTCGATSSFAVHRARKSTYFWGITSKTGDSTMYPKPLYDLQGNEMHCFASGNTSTVAATDRTIVSWGPSPTYGELGLGEGNAKSSVKPKIIEDLDGLYCSCIATGIAFTAMIVHVSTSEDEDVFQKLKECTVSEKPVAAIDKKQTEKRKNSDTKRSSKAGSKTKRRKRAR